MSDSVKGSNNNKVDFDPILPESGILFYEECPLGCEIEKPRLLPLKTSTQIRFEQLQQEAARVWKEDQKSKKTSSYRSPSSS